MHSFQPWNNQYYINPLYHPASCNRSIQVVAPATLEPLGKVALCEKHDIQIAVDAANLAQRHWRQLDGRQRKRLLLELAHGIETAGERNLEIVRLLSLELGLSSANASCELASCAAVFRHYAHEIESPPGTTATWTGDLESTQVHHQAYGVSVHIMPFSLGLILMCRTVAASLAAGNSCIVKPSLNATLSTLAFMQHFALLPAGLVCCIPGDAAAGQGLLQSSGTHAVVFAGGVAAASAVAVTCAELLKPCAVESAGRGSMIVSRHAQVQLAAVHAAASAFNRSGQSCLSTQRIFVDDEIHDHFVQHFVEQTRIRCLVAGAASPVGPLVSESAQHRLMRLINDALAKGARRVSSDEQSIEDPLLGWFHQPVILTNINDSMLISREECLGPVAILRRVGDFAESVQLANECPFALGVSVFSNDLAEVLLATEQLQASRVWFNSHVATGNPDSFSDWEIFQLAGVPGCVALDAFRHSRKVSIHQPVTLRR